MSKTLLFKMLYFLYNCTIYNILFFILCLIFLLSTVKLYLLEIQFKEPLFYYASGYC